jgi:hypothetical protein
VIYLSFFNYLIDFYWHTAWLESVGSRVLYELDPKKPVLYVVPVESILGKLPVVPVGDFGSVPNGMRAQFPNALADRTPGAGDGCPVWYVNSWALGWSRET